jgi:WD40 repeat protein
VNIDTGAVDREFRANGSPAHAVAMSKDGGLIAVGSRDGTVRVWDLDR